MTSPSLIAQDRAAGPSDLSPVPGLRGAASHDAGAQQRLNALRVAGKMLASILEAEQGDGHIMVYRDHAGRFVVATAMPRCEGRADALDAAFAQFLANRSDAARRAEREAEIRARVEAEMGEAA